MSTTRVATVTDTLFPRFTAPDLGLAEEFLTTLGLVTVERTSTQLFLRGTGGTHHIYVAELGDPRFVGVAFEVGSEEDLERLASLPGASAVHELDEPGGGRRVVLKEPNGYQIEVIHGMERVEPTLLPELISNTNAAPAARTGRGPWGADEPPHIIRFGHAVQKTEAFAETSDWYKDHLGLVESDLGIDDQGALNGAFLKLDAGSRYVDHHCLQIAGVPQQGWHHVSFEVQNWNEVFAGAAYINRLGKYKRWGAPQRHYVGGQLGVYFADPWGRIHEFWADGDRVNDEHEPQKWTMERILAGQPMWEDPPEFEFFLQVMQ